MIKPKKYIFQPVGGVWKNVTVDSVTLADFLTRLGILIDDKTQFARLRDYENNRFIIYRTMSNENYNRNMAYDIKKYICRYTIYQEKNVVERNIIGWRTALAHARKYATDLFNTIKRVEILNVWTGEIVTLEEAERRSAAHKARH